MSDGVGFASFIIGLYTLFSQNRAQGGCSLSSRAEVFEIVQAGILELESSLSADMVTGDSRLEEDLKMDSLAQLELVEIMQDKFDLEIPTEVLDGVRTVNDVVGLVLRYLEGDSGGSPPVPVVE